MFKGSVIQQDLKYRSTHTVNAYYYDSHRVVIKIVIRIFFFFSVYLHKFKEKLTVIQNEVYKKNTEVFSIIIK